MKDEKYGRRTFEALLSGRQAEEIFHDWVEIRDDGVWLAPPARFSHLDDLERNVIQWHPRRNPDLPALPFPFTASELAAFFLYGPGRRLYDRYDDRTGGLDEENVAAMSTNAETAREALEEAHRLVRKARKEFFPLGPIDRPTNKDIREAADWLLEANSQLVPQVAGDFIKQHSQPASAPEPDRTMRNSNKRWTASELDELRAYRSQHGTKKAAEKFNISVARVRQLLPAEKPQLQGYSVYNQRTKQAKGCAG